MADVTVSFGGDLLEGYREIFELLNVPYDFAQLPLESIHTAQLRTACERAKEEITRMKNLMSETKNTLEEVTRNDDLEREKEFGREAMKQAEMNEAEVMRLQQKLEEEQRRGKEMEEFILRLKKIVEEGKKKREEQAALISMSKKGNSTDEKEKFDTMISGDGEATRINQNLQSKIANAEEEGKVDGEGGKKNADPFPQLKQKEDKDESEMKSLKMLLAKRTGELENLRTELDKERMERVKIHKTATKHYEIIQKFRSDIKKYLEDGTDNMMMDTEQQEEVQEIRGAQHPKCPNIKLSNNDDKHASTVVVHCVLAKVHCSTCRNELLSMIDEHACTHTPDQFRNAGPVTRSRGKAGKEEEKKKKELSSANTSRNHYRLMSSPGYFCVCGVQYNDAKELLEHVDFFTKHGIMHFQCTVCFKRFKRPQTLQDHKDKEHGKKLRQLFGCQDCRGTFLTRNALERHRLKDHITSSKNHETRDNDGEHMELDENGTGAAVNETVIEDVEMKGGGGDGPQDEAAETDLMVG